MGGLKRFRVAVLLFAAFASPAVFPQPVRDRDPTFLAARKIAADLLKATYHWGPLYLLSRFELADIGYDQQISSIPTEEQVGGFGFGVSAPQRLYFVPRRKVVFSVDAVPSYHWFSSSDRGNQFGYSLRGDAHFLLNHLYLDFYVAQADRLRASTLEVNRLVTQTQTETGTAGEFRYSTRTSLTFGASYRDARHPRSRVQPEDIDIDRLDRTEHRVQGGFRHKTFPLTALRTSAHAVRYDFTSADENDSRRVFLGGGFEYENGPTTLQVEAGPGVLDFERPEREDFRGVLGNAQARRRAGRRWQLAAIAIRDLDFSITPENGYYTTDRGVLGVEYSASRRLTLRASTQGGRDSYEVPVGGIRRKDSFQFTSVGWSYATRYVAGGFDVGYFERNSTLKLEEQDGIRLLVHLSFTP